MSNRSVRRLFAVPIGAMVIALSAMVVQPDPVAAACYWGPWKVSRGSVGLTNMMVYSTVYYRIGYTCSGYANEVEVDARYATVDVRGSDNGAYLCCYTRDFQAMHLYRADGDPVDYHDPNRTCTAGNCYLTGQDVANFHFYLSGSAQPFIHIYCFRCDPSGLVSVVAQHYFRTNQMYANWQQWDFTPR